MCGTVLQPGVELNLTGPALISQCLLEHNGGIFTGGLTYSCSEITDDL